MHTYWETDNEVITPSDPCALIGTDGYVHVLDYRISDDNKRVSIAISDLHRLLEKDDCKAISIEKWLKSIAEEMKHKIYLEET